MHSSLVYNQTADSTQVSVHKMELAARNIDKALLIDSNAPRLLDLMNVNPQTGSTVSGLTDQDYPTLNGLPLTVNNMTQMKCINNVPLPPEIVNHLSHVQCHCMMGLFPAINRAWLTVDSDIYIWTYEENSDLSYFDGVCETILSVGLVKPKPGVFHAFIKYLLVLTTSVDIVVLGMTFTEGPSGPLEEIQLIPDPVFTIPTDGSTVSVIEGTNEGRLFLGTKEGSLYEIYYQAESSWFGKRCKKINLSTSTLSFLVPSFLNAALSEEDGICQISIDNSRQILYTLTEKGTIEVCDLGEKGNSFSRVTKIFQSTLVNQAMNTVKTLDSQNFRPIVSISAVEAFDSGNINLVAVSQTGVRFYLSVTSISNTQPNQRPYTLTLVHVRLPPGYSANITVRPRAVHLSSYRDRNLVLISRVNEKDVLWCMSSDLFPFCQSLTEAYNTLDIDGMAVAIAEAKPTINLYNTCQEAPPVVVRQHVEEPKKYIVLTSSGVQIFGKLRPVDLLMQILKDSNGRDTEALKAFFMVQREDQACATALILASEDTGENYDVSEGAARAFFMFGGEPKVNATSMFSGTTMFNPNIISTPAQSQYQPKMFPQSPNLSRSLSMHHSFDTNTPFLFSAKHNGLYLYLGRILRPIWNRSCVDKVFVDDKTVINQSTISSDDCLYILDHLVELDTFLKRNTQLSTTGNATFQNEMSVTRMNQTLQDAQLEERKSLQSLKTFVTICCQIVGLWRILCEHQFHVLIGALPENQQQILQNLTFKELFLYRQDICSILISTLVNTYLGDNASVDSISSKLREVCPLLYKKEDATFSKANEILKSSRSLQNIDEKEELLASALQLCKTIAPNVNLHDVCREFMSLKAYNAVIELCSYCAAKIDPENIAETFYNLEADSVDQEGYNYFQKRMEVYQHVLDMLETLYLEQNHVNQSTNDLNLGLTDSVLLQVIVEVLDNPDKIMHVALYEWMVSKNMSSDLIRIAKPSLENYLKRSSTHDPENIAIMDLLWKFYERNDNHAAAAKVLNNLASRAGNSVSLKDRLSYLARAIMCMRSDKVGYAPYLGVFLRDLEDKMEVAKVQELILETIDDLSGLIPNANDAIVALNSGLYEISQLYENFAEPFRLLECQLAIIDCAGYTDSVLIESIWQQILSDELLASSGSGSDRIGKILTKVKFLARQYAQSTHCFPLSYIVYELEIVNAKLKGDKHLVSTTLITMNIPFVKLMTVYNNLIMVSINDNFWQQEENEFHLCEATAALINCFLDSHESYNNIEKRKIISLCQDTVATLLSNLYSKPNTDELVNDLRNIQTKLSRI